MSAVQPLSMEQITADPHLAEIFAGRIERTGYISNSLRVMAHVPSVVEAVDALVATAFFQGRVETSLKMLMFLLFSSRWGCQYCQAHAVVNVKRAGVSDEQLDAVWDFEASDAFDERMRAALTLAREAAMAGSVTEAHHARLRAHFDEAEIVELISVLATGALLNTWNSAVGTELEPVPLELAEERLASRGWTGHGHRPA